MIGRMAAKSRTWSLIHCTALKPLLAPTVRSTAYRPAFILMMGTLAVDITFAFHTIFSRLSAFSILRSMRTSSSRSFLLNPPPPAHGSGPTPITTKSISAHFSARPVAPDPKTSNRDDGYNVPIASRTFFWITALFCRSETSGPAVDANVNTCECKAPYSSQSSWESPDNESFS